MPKKLGAHLNSNTGEVQFNVYSKNASLLKIYFYKESFGADEIFSRQLSAENGNWQVSIPMQEFIENGISTSHVFYGYRAWGPNWNYSDNWEKGSMAGYICDVDFEGNRFNPNKLLIDPYAKELSHDPQVAKLYMDPNSYICDYFGGEYRCIDTGKLAPKSIVTLSYKAVDFGLKPRMLLKDDVIYEVNLRGFTMLDESLPEVERGTFIGAAKKAVYLKELGITAIEFLPVQEFADEQNDDGDPRGDNYWGYMTINYFSPNRRYSSDKSPGGPTREFKEMVKAFHEQGIKVLLDVVYNHTGEGLLMRKVTQGTSISKEEIETAKREACKSRGSDELQDSNAACILSYSGLDNKSYYILRDNNSRYEGRGGCGANLNYDNEAVRNLIIDSLKYWADEMGVDGFRFDLAPILNLRSINGEIVPDENCTLLKKISIDLPSRNISFEKGVDLIAEPWGDGTFIDWTDKFPDDWSVWNMHFRDILKKSMNKYGVADVCVGEISKVLSGSKEIIGKKPYNSINYFVSHDDCNSTRNLFSYNSFFHLDEATIKHDQMSWDQGGNLEMQKKAVRNAFTLLMFSIGIPMFAGGDELFRAIPPYNSETGNMNMVSVDQEDIYIDFSSYNKQKTMLESGDSASASNLAKTDDSLQIFNFVKGLIQFRSKHESLRPSEYFTGNIIDEAGLKDIAWYKEDGSELYASDWQNNAFLAYRICSQFEKLKDENDRVYSIFVAYNKSPEVYKILLPKNVSGYNWRLIFNTHNAFDGTGKPASLQIDREYIIHGRSLLVFIEV